VGDGRGILEGEGGRRGVEGGGVIINEERRGGVGEKEWGEGGRVQDALGI